MESFSSYLLDIIGEFSGGRGLPQNAYVQYGIGAMLFGALLIWAIRKRKANPSPRESLLVIGFAFGLAREIFKLGISSLKLQVVF